MSSRVQRVLVIQDASRELSADPIRLTLHGLSLKPGDKIKIMRIVQPFRKANNRSPLLSYGLLAVSKSRLHSSATILKRQESIDREIRKKLAEFETNNEMKSILFLMRNQQVIYKLLLTLVSCIATGNRSTCRNVKTMASVSMVATRCHSCGSSKCQCNLQNGYACATSRNLASEICRGQDCDGSKMEHGIKLISDTCRSDPESDGAVSVLVEENICSSPQSSSLGTYGATAEGWSTASDLQLSPKKALLDHVLQLLVLYLYLVEKVDPVKLRQ